MAAAKFKLQMVPGTGERTLRFVGDRIRFVLRRTDGGSWPHGWRALLRTNVGRGSVLRQEIITSRGGEKPMTGASWRDIPMRRDGDEWFVELALAEVGYSKAKAYAVDDAGWQVWPEGPDMGVSVHPDAYRTANTIYCAFTRLFGESRSAITTADKPLEVQLKSLDKRGYTIIPPSGKLRDLIGELPHITDTLGCRILHLLPVNPTPTTYARFGRYGSPYAGLDLTAIDPALVEFDLRTTGVDQFRELAFAVHARGARLFLDLVINHTGWSSTLHEKHPEWFVRGADGAFVSPGAWGVTWEDLVELDESDRALWDCLAEAFLTWCRRGVDGFRCDAGYKVPMPVWQYITARVREQFPDTLFLLEGLGGGWIETEALLTEGGMQWAYSELFQEFSGSQVAGYLDHALKQSERVGVLVHYSETHDNDRLAKKGRAWSLLRNRLSALASVNGGYGFTCGVEWLAIEKILVHGCAGLAWGSDENILPELAALNRLLAEHPCFFDSAKLTRLSKADSPVFALRRDSAEGKDSVIVLVNTDVEKPGVISFDRDKPSLPPGFSLDSVVDLLGQSAPKVKRNAAGDLVLKLDPGACFCLSAASEPMGLSGESYRLARARAAWAIDALGAVLGPEDMGPQDWRLLGDLVDRDARGFLGSLRYLEPALATADLLSALDAARGQKRLPQVVEWTLIDRRRITPVPPGHWLFIRDSAPFRVLLQTSCGSRHAQSIAAQDEHIAFFPPVFAAGDAQLSLERYAITDHHVEAAIRFLTAEPAIQKSEAPVPRSALVLLTNGIGGMARLSVDLGRIGSKYDCLLGANLNARVPVDRHIFAKRVRVWANASGFISPLNADSLIAFEPGPPARWRFAANAGDGRTAEIELTAEMVEAKNTTILRFKQVRPERFHGLASGVDVRLTVRVDIEDRNFHWETKRNGSAEIHFSANTKALPDASGFEFTPAPDRQLRVFSDAGAYHPEPEWSENIPHPVEASRGQDASGDAYSPGWFEVPLAPEQAVTLAVTAEKGDPGSVVRGPLPVANESSRPSDEFETRLARAAQAFVVRRGEGRTVIAGYPWFLDWGRDTLICARGLLAAGLVEEVKQILLTFARFEDRGTLPNTIFGDDASNRDTSDAPLWFGIVCEEVAAIVGNPFYSGLADKRGRSIADVLPSIATHYRDGTPTGIRMDAASGLIWSPGHFSWMDTNHPSGTPREGYPIEIQVLWIRLLRQLGRIGAAPDGEPWDRLADRAETSLKEFYWLEDRGYFADCLIAKSGEPAASAQVDTALRCNYLFAVSLGLVTGEKAHRCVEAASRYLLVPGALRSLAPLPVTPPLPIYGADGRLLNNPVEPYCGRYEGDEDTQRKPAYHNGTAWVWTLPIFCEALARAWDFSRESIAAARAYLGSAGRLLDEGCLGHLPEIVDGDAPHQQRGCDAQAWSTTETLRVRMLLKGVANSPTSGKAGSPI
jgi:starch synthase (maltosyl-transferring)